MLDVGPGQLRVVDIPDRHQENGEFEAVASYARLYLKLHSGACLAIASNCMVAQGRNLLGL